MYAPYKCVYAYYVSLCNGALFDALWSSHMSGPTIPWDHVLREKVSITFVVYWGFLLFPTVRRSSYVTWSDKFSPEG